MEQFIQAFSEAGNMEVVKEAWELMKQMGLQPSQVIFFCTLILFFKNVLFVFWIFSSKSFNLNTKSIHAKNYYKDYYLLTYSCITICCLLSACGYM
jgi:pentatricopeptide repeat protein